MKGSIVAASAFVGAVAASHVNHAGLHLRRGADADVCTVYTTVYVYPSRKPQRAFQEATDSENCLADPLS